MSNVMVLFEVSIGDRWCPVRIARQFPSIHAALDSLPVFAKQQRVELDRVRARALRTPSALCAAENAVIEYHREQMDDPRR